MGRWNDAIKFGRQWIAEQPQEATRWSILTPTIVLGDGQIGYEAHCNALLEQFEDVNNSSDACKIIKACCLLPDSVDTKRLPLKPVEKAIEEGTVERIALSEMWNTLALVALRSGQTDEVLGFVNESEQCTPSQYTRDLNVALSALAKIQLSDLSGALVDFARGSVALAGRRSKPHELQFHEQQMLEVFLREAKDGIDELLPDGVRPYADTLSALDDRESLTLCIEFEAWDLAAPHAIKVSQQLEPGNWNAERSRFLQELVEIEPLFEAMLESTTETSEIWLNRGRVLALRSEWTEAAEAFTRVTESNVAEAHVWFESACALRIVGDDAGYRQLVDKFLKQIGDQPTWDERVYLARTLGLAPQEQALAQRAVEIVQLAVDENNRPWVVHAQGLVQFRAGDYQKARTTLELSLDTAWQPSQNQAALAMVNSAMQLPVQAKEQLRLAQESRKQLLADSVDGVVRLLVIDWLALNALIREAEKALSDVPG